MSKVTPMDASKPVVVTAKQMQKAPKQTKTVETKIESKKQMRQEKQQQLTKKSNKKENKKECEEAKRRKLLVDIKVTLLNVIDNGACSGPWAVTQVEGRLTVSRTRLGILRWVLRIAGVWETFEGAQSPQKCVIQPDDGRGTFTQVYKGTVSSVRIVPSPDRVVYDFGGTRRQVLEKDTSGPSFIRFLEEVLGAQGVTNTYFKAVYRYRKRIVWTDLFEDGTDTSVGDVVVRD